MNIVRKAQDLWLKQHTWVNMVMINHLSKNHITDSTKNPDPRSEPSKHMQNATQTHGTNALYGAINSTMYMYIYM